MRTLLIVDDNLSVRESLRLLLERRGFAVVTAVSGMDALAIAAQQPFDGAMIDVQMPGMGGIELCRKLREAATAAGRPFVVWMMTGGRSPEIEKRSLEAGALALLGKPFNYAELFRRFDEQWPTGPAEAPNEPPAASAGDSDVSPAQ